MVLIIPWGKSQYHIVNNRKYSRDTRVSDVKSSGVILSVSFCKSEMPSKYMYH